MSRTSRLLVLAAAWVLPAAWVLLALLSGPSDGTSLASGLPGSGAARWSEPVRVARTYGDTALRVGDEVRLVDGRTLADWVADPSVERRVGEVVRYEVRRAGEGLDRIQQVDVTLVRYPVAAAPGTPIPDGRDLRDRRAPRRRPGTGTNPAWT